MTTLMFLLAAVTLPGGLMGYCCAKDVYHLWWLFGGPLLSMVITFALAGLDPVGAFALTDNPHDLLGKVMHAYSTVFGWPVPLHPRQS